MNQKRQPGARAILGWALALACGLTLPAYAQAPAAPPPVSPASLGLVVYPAKGQDANQQRIDESACYQWSATQAPTATATPQPAPPPSGAVRGGARGAGAGAAIGAVSGNAGRGAAVGATAGGIHGRHQAKEQQQAAAAQAQAQAGAGFKKAYSACLQGRGYTVK